MMRRSRLMRGALAVSAVAWMIASPASMRPALGQAAWPFQLEWDNTGAQPSYHQLCVNGSCRLLTDARNTQGARWRASLPMLPPGEYRLVVEACGAGTCLPGSPDLVIRVLQPAARRPPIDVLEGPRIPVGR